MKISKKIGIYLHLPFCEKRCKYCDFYSQTSFEAELIKTYISSMCKEIELYAENYSDAWAVDSIFFGGGTPSAISEEYILEILECISSNLKVLEAAEISIEANPNSITYEKLLAYKNAGINRISIGVQSFFEEDLKFLGRVHTEKQAVRAFEMARMAGFSNINIDLMFAYKRGFEQGLEKSLKNLIALKPEHVSFYSLQLEEKTSLYREYELKKFDLPTEDEDRKAYALGVKRLEEAGYEHYEISNFALKGKECKHNLKYWSMEEYIGIGASASSYFNRTRRTNAADINAYIKAIREADAWESINLEEKNKNSLKDDMVDYVITTMRRSKGLNFEDFKSRYGMDFFEAFTEGRMILEDYVERGIIRHDGNSMRFTMEGISVSNTFLAEFV